MTCDLLVFGPHPDDIEIGFGGCAATHVDLGWRVGLCDLTRGELGSNGTVDTRQAEAMAAAEVLGVAWRHNLGWPDGGIIGDAAQLDDAVALVRQCRPAVVAVPHWHDRHPDHEAASRVLRQAVFRSGLRRVLGGGAAWKVEQLCFYGINEVAAPSLVIDVSAAYERKRNALSCYRSQFHPEDPDAIETRLTGERFLRMIESRDAHLGALVHVDHAEGVVLEEPIVRASLGTRALRRDDGHE